MGGTLMSDVWTALVCAALAERGTAEARIRLSGKDTGKWSVWTQLKVRPEQLGRGGFLASCCLFFLFKTLFFLGLSIKKQKHKDINLSAKIQWCI